VSRGPSSISGPGNGQPRIDPSRTIERFGWQPRYTFEQTIRRMLSWYDLHGVTAIYSHLKAPPSVGERV